MVGNTVILINLKKQKHMKTSFLKTLSIILFSSLFIAGACSNDDDDANDPNNGNNEEPYQTTSQDVIDQEFFIEGIYISGPGRDEVRPVPNAAGQQPVSGKPFIEMVAGFPESETIYFGIIGQRLLDETVSGDNEIANTLSPQPFDHSNVVFAVDRTDDNNAPNAKLQSIQSISYVSELNDIQEQVNWRITQSKFIVTALEEGVFGYTTAGEPIETITFVANEEAFVDSYDGNIVAKYNAEIFSFDELLNNTFSNTTEFNINVIERVTNISNSWELKRYYGLDD